MDTKPKINRRKNRKSTFFRGNFLEIENASFNFI